MRPSRVVRVVWAIALALAMQVSVAHAAKTSAEDKLDICHIPPGTPWQSHTITIGAGALPAHLAHGDLLGPCQNDCRLFGTDCDDGDACTADSCDPATGACLHGQPTDCDDGDVCTDDSCDPVTGECRNEVVPLRSCDDGDACTSADVCQVGVEHCAGTPTENCCESAEQCGDGNPCTIDGCTMNQCTHDAKDCDDGDACTVDGCSPLDGECMSAPKNCDDQDESTVDSCDQATGMCVNEASCREIGTLCDSAADCCSDVCLEGLCVTIAPIGDPYGPNTDPDAEAAARAGLCTAPDIPGEFCSPWKPCCQPSNSCLIYEDSKGLCYDLSEFSTGACIQPSPSDPNPSCSAGADDVYDECCWGYCDDPDFDGHGTCRIFNSEPTWDCTRGTDGSSGTLFSGDEACSIDLPCCNGSACNLATGNCHP